MLIIKFQLLLMLAAPFLTLGVVALARSALRRLFHVIETEAGIAELHIPANVLDDLSSKV